LKIPGNLEGADALEADEGGRRMRRTWLVLAFVLASAVVLILGISDQAAKTAKAEASLAAAASER
jgi:hypothetical protein